MKYEVEFVIPVVIGHPRYGQRFRDFRRVGLLNIPDGKKVKVVLLAKKDTVGANMLSGWPKGCDVYVNEYESKSHIFKLCQYHLDINQFNSKWYAAVDDDSVTDVGGLLTVLSDYDHKKPLYFSTPYHHGDEKPMLELNLLKKLGLLRKLKGNFDTDWESHYVSRAGLMKMLRNASVRKYIDERKKIDDGFSDLFLPYSAKLSGVPVKDASFFSTPHAERKKFTLMGGNMCHIHYISHDYNNIRFIKQMKNRFGW